MKALIISNKSIYLLKLCSTTHRFISINNQRNFLRYHSNQHNFQRKAPPRINYDKKLQVLVEKYEDKLVFNSKIQSFYPNLSYKNSKILQSYLERQEKSYYEETQLKHRPFPVALKNLPEYANISQEASNNGQNERDKKITNHNQDEKIINFPFEKPTQYNNVGNIEQLEQIQSCVDLEDEIITEKLPMNWSADYDIFPEEDYEGEMESWKMNYGTANPNSKISNVPCGGCGAPLHCKDTSLPGFIPSEVYTSVKLLRGILCQRCHFLKTYDVALQCRVNHEDYPKILGTIKDKRALVILMVDLLDFPCSIWPGIIDILGNKRPVVVVGNKVDLLPQDSKGYLNYITNVLKEAVMRSTIGKANVKHVALISAQAGFGVEELITKLHNVWHYKGDVYIIGCTNVGKSTLFNTLLQSDYCKVQAVDLIQRATTSRWPGTTLNLLKFPILRPSGWRLHVRTKRLMQQNKINKLENEIRLNRLRSTRNSQYTNLIGCVNRTFLPDSPMDAGRDPFSVNLTPNPGDKMIGINEKSKEYVNSKWCFDTPGVVHPDQILHLLTGEELLLTIPKKPLEPRTLALYPNHSIFIAGLARLDAVGVQNGILRVTIFASNELPITICSTSRADSLYNELLGTELFNVPIGNKERLKKWPGLKFKEECFHFEGVDNTESVADIILSSAGWISIAPSKHCKCQLKAWTPEARGIYQRSPLLPHAIKLKGKRIRGSPAYLPSRLFVPK